MNIFKRWIYNRFKGQMQNHLQSLIMGSLNYGPAWTPTDQAALIDKGYAYNATVYSIINLIIKAAGRFDWNLYQVKDDKALRKFKNFNYENIPIKSAFRTKALEEITGHQINDIWERPNPNQGNTEWLAQNIGFKLITGNSYTYGIGPETGPNKGTKTELWNLPSQIMKVKVDGIAKPVKGFTSILDQNLFIPAEEIMHRKYWTPLYENGQFAYGLSPIQAGSKVLTRSNDSYTASVAMYQNHGAKGILTSNSPAGVTAMTQAQAEELKQKYYEDYGGPEKIGKMVITGAHLKWEQIGMSPVDLGIIAGEKMDTRTLCNLYTVQSQLLNDPENKTYANQKDAMKALLLNAAIPELEDLRDELNRWWIPAFGENLYFDFDASGIAELQEDIQKLVDNLTKAWWLTPNQRLAAMNYDPSDEQGMDQVWIPTGLIPINENIIGGEDLRITE